MLSWLLILLVFFVYFVYVEGGVRRVLDSTYIEIYSGQTISLSQTTTFATQQYFINTYDYSTAHITFTSTNNNYATSLYLQASTPANANNYLESYQTCDTNNCSPENVAIVDVDFPLSSIYNSEGSAKSAINQHNFFLSTKEAWAVTSNPHILYLNIICQAHYPTCCTSFPPCISNITVSLSGTTEDDDDYIVIDQSSWIAWSLGITIGIALGCSMAYFWKYFVRACGYSTHGNDSNGSINHFRCICVVKRNQTTCTARNTILIVCYHYAKTKFQKFFSLFFIIFE
jgi:hypothetical protein